MSFDIVMRSSRKSGRTAAIRNPFTGETQVVDVDDSLTDAERRAVKDILTQHGAASADDFGYYTPSFSDGSTAEVQFTGLIDDPDFAGGAIAIHDNSAPIFQFLFAVAAAGNFIIQPVMEGSPKIVTKWATADAIADRFSDILIAESHADLALIMSTGVAVWNDYRHHVT